MGALVIGALRVDLGMETSAFSRGSSQAQKEARALGDRMQAIGGRMQNVGAVMTAVSGTIVAGFVAMTKKGLEYASGLGETAQQLGVTTDELQKFRYAASQVGVEQETMDKSLAKLTVNIGKAATGNAAAQKAFDSLGISVKDAEGNVKSAGTIMPEIADAIAKIPDPARRAAAEVALFGKSGQALDTLLAGGAAKMNELTNAAKELGIVLSPEQIQKADDAADKFAALQQVLSARIAGVVADNSDAILSFVEGLGNAIAGVMGFFDRMGPGLTTFVLGAAALGTALGPVLMAIGSLVSMGGALVPLFAEGGMLAGGFAALGGVIAPFIPIIAAVAAAGALIYANWDKIAPVLEQIRDRFVEAIGPKVTALIETVSGLLTELWAGPFGDLIRGAISILGEFMSVYTQVLGEVLTRVLGAALELVKGTFDQIGNAIKLVAAILSGDWAGAWEAAKAIVSTFVNTTLGVMESLVPGITGSMMRLYNGVKTWLQDKLGAVFEWVGKKVETVKGYFFDLYDAVVGHSYIPDMVDGIAAQMRRLDGVMVDQAGKATAKTSDAFRKMAGEISPLLDRLFPEVTDENKYRAEMALIDKAEKAGQAGGGISSDAAAEARKRLRDEHMGPVVLAGDYGDDGPIDIDLEGIQRELDKTIGVIDDGLVKRTAEQTAQVVENFAGMAKGIIGSLDNMVKSFKDGDILGGIMGVLDLVGQVAGLIGAIKGGGGGGGGGGGLGGLGAIGGIGGLGGGLGGLGLLFGGGRALGGAVVPGKAYRVGEKGAEYFTPGVRGTISPDGARRGSVYNISGNLLTDEFWSQIQEMDDQAAMKGALSGANMVQTISQKRGRQRLGRGR